jgi:hypothetical protein
MSPILPNPDPIALPAPVLLLKVLLVGTLPLHLIPMNLALGGGFVAALAAWRSRTRLELESRRWRALGDALATPLLVTTALTISFGIAPLLFIQVLYGQLFYTSSILMAWWWLAVIALIMAGYYSYYAFAFKRRGNGAPLLALAGAVLLALVGFMFTNNMTLMLRPDRWAALYAASEHGLHLNLSDPTHGPRYLHFLVASFAVTGLFLALRGRRGRGEEASFLRSFGARLFAGATHVQILVGLAFLFMLPAGVRGVFLGGSVRDTSVLWAAVALGLAATVAVRRSPPVAAGLIAATLFGMAYVRHCVRELMIAPVFDAQRLKVETQTGLVVLFAVILVVGLGVLVWMGRRFARARPSGA